MQGENNSTSEVEFNISLPEKIFEKLNKGTEYVNDKLAI